MQSAETPSRALRTPIMGLAAVALAALLLGCSEELTGPDVSGGELAVAKKGGPPSQCGAGTNLSIAFGDTPGDVLASDGEGPYVEAVDNVGAHINDPTGRLMLWPSQYGTTSRFVIVTTATSSYATTDRIYTNNHDADGDGVEDPCGLVSIPAGGSGLSVLQAEGDANGIVNYGKTCDGSVVDIPGSNEKVDISRSADGQSWTITGAHGVHCLTSGKGKNKTVTETPVGGFSMTLSAI